jgi:DNA recombination protein RmuC
MKEHLRGLAGKDYRSAILKDYRQSGREGDVARILSVMYLPNESALEKLNHADPAFAQKAAKEGIIPAGPVSLSAIVGFASKEINLGRQAANQENIILAVQSLLESVGRAVKSIDDTGKSIKSAARHFGALTSSMNSRLLPRARKLASLGVHPANNKALPKAIKSYQLVDTEAPDIIDGEAVEINDAELLSDQRDDG